MSTAEAQGGQAGRLVGWVAIVTGGACAIAQLVAVNRGTGFAG
jgi:hypothetical protein